MNIIVRYIGLSWKKNFAYRVNGFLVILDTMMDCFTLWLFWASLLELDLDLMGWTPEAIRLFLGYSLISSAVANLFVGAWDIGDHIPDGTLDTYLVRPCNPVLLILLERANFLRFAVTFPAGLVMVLRYGGSGHPALLLGGIALSILGTVMLQMLVLCVYILSFWFKKMDTCADIFESALSVSRYPLVFFGKKLGLFLTYVLPVAFTATIPTELVAGQTLRWSLPAFLGLSVGFVLLAYGLWRAGRRKYESAN